MKQRWLLQVFMVLLVTMGVTLLCSLGFWQLERANKKQNILTNIEKAKKLTSLSNQDLALEHDPMALRYSAVKLKGSFLKDKIILLDNKFHNSKVGYHVIEPFNLNNGTLILINRGWVPLGATRQRFPALPPVKGEVTIEGYLDFAYRNRFISNSLESTIIKWPLRMQQIDNQLLTQHLGKNLYPMLVNLSKNSPYAFVAAELSAPPISPSRHRGYAIQWFALAATLSLMTFIALRRSKK